MEVVKQLGRNPVFLRRSLNNRAIREALSTHLK